jgi:hypothetical protein
MPVGDAAAAYGLPLVPDSGSGGEVRLGAQEINRTRDFVANVATSIPNPVPVNRGGTGATTVGGAQNGLGFYSGTAAASDSVAAAVDGTVYFQILG